MPLKRIATLRVDRLRWEAAPILTLDVIESGTGRPVGEPWTVVSDPPGSGVADIEPGDVLFGKLRPHLAKVALVTANAYASTELLCLRPEPEVDSRWLAYCLLSRRVVDWATASSEGTKMPRTSWERLGELVVPMPNLVEQRTIADFLDTETARLDALIAKKQALLDALDNRESVVIESRIIESAQHESSLRRLLSQPPQYGAGEQGVEGDEGWPRYIRITDLSSDGTLRSENVKRLSEEIARPYLLLDGDLLFARSGATAGKAFRYQQSMGRACFAGYLIRLRMDARRASPEFIELWTRTMHYRSQIAQSAIQATIQNVSAEKYLALTVPDVPPEEQTSIVRDLARLRERSSTMRTTFQRQIELLNERRISLITAAVTGDLAIPWTAA